MTVTNGCACEQEMEILRICEVCGHGSIDSGGRVGAGRDSVSRQISTHVPAQIIQHASQGISIFRRCRLFPPTPHTHPHTHSSP